MVRRPSVTALVLPGDGLGNRTLERHTEALRSALRAVCGSFEILVIATPPFPARLEDREAVRIRTRRGAEASVLLEEALCLSRGSVILHLPARHPSDPAAVRALLSPIRRGHDLVLPPLDALRLEGGRFLHWVGLGVDALASLVSSPFAARRHALRALLDDRRARGVRVGWLDAMPVS